MLKTVHAEGPVLRTPRSQLLVVPLSRRTCATGTDLESYTTACQLGQDHFVPFRLKISVQCSAGSDSTEPVTGRRTPVRTLPAGAGAKTVSATKIWAGANSPDGHRFASEKTMKKEDLEGQQATDSAKNGWIWSAGNLETECSQRASGGC